MKQVLLMSVMVLAVFACRSSSLSQNPQTEEIKNKEFNTFPMPSKAEIDANFTWTGKNSDGKAIDGGLEWNISSTSARSFDFKVQISAGNNPGTVMIAVDGDVIGKSKFQAEGETQTIKVAAVFLGEGPNQVSITTNSKTAKIISAQLGNSLEIKYPIQALPSDPNATKETKQLMKFLSDNYGKHILSGVMDLAWDDKINMVDKVQKAVGKKPAIQGFDFINYLNNPDGGSGLKQVEEALKWAESGGIVTFCWHWRVGDSKEFYSAKTDFRINLDPKSKEYKQIIADIDLVSAQLKRLQDAKVPVLWRPLHEASGKWFWWGASGAKNCIDLYRLIYDRMVNVHGLHNLIWVSNMQDNDWYPGDDVVDIISTDIYAQGDFQSFKDSWKLNQGAVKGPIGKIVALSENGSIPDPDELIRDKTPWSWFMVWNDSNSASSKDNFWSGENHNPKKHKEKVFNHPYVWNLDDIQGKIFSDR